MEKEKEKETDKHLKLKNNIEHLSWLLTDKYFTENPNNLVAHHIESYNDFFSTGINRIFRENNPIRFIDRESMESESNVEQNECMLYLGGKDGSKIYFGKPIIYDDKHTHYMYPNDARLRNMTYGMTIHYDVDVDFIFYVEEDGKTVKKETTTVLEKIYLGRFPIMLQSKYCILNGLSKEVRFNMGECRNDYGGYFIIDGKEKLIIPQETFADNMLYIRKYKEDDVYSHSAEIKSVSEDASKPIRTTSVKIVAPSTTYTNNQIVVDVPNVKKPIPLFILMRALGVESDKDIIKTCLLKIEDEEGNQSEYVDLFIPSVHDANNIFDQQTALRYIKTFTKRGTISDVIEILSDYFLPHIGEMNFLEKAYFLGYMVNRLLKVYTNQEKPTDRDNYKFKRVELTGTLLYDLFREYYLIQKRAIAQKIDEEYYFHSGEYKTKEEAKEAKKMGKTEREKMENKYKHNFTNLIETNFKTFFKDLDVEKGFKKAFKGNWGAQTHTKRLGVVQDLNRLSWYTFISQLRKLKLPMDSSSKIVRPRLLNNSQYGFIDPVDIDGGNIGLDKTLAICTHITSGSSAHPIIKWLRGNTHMKILTECTPEYLNASSKIFVNGNWVGVIDSPLELVNMMKLYRRNGIFPVFTSVSFDYEHNEIHIYTDSGRLTRPIYYIDEDGPSYNREKVLQNFENGRITWNQIITGFGEKTDPQFSIHSNKLYDLQELYPNLQDANERRIRDILKMEKSVIDYIDTSEEETALIAAADEDYRKNKYYTHIEINPSFMFGVMGNLIIYPENNPLARNAFSCSQSRQAVSMYHSNYPVRIDKMGVVLNYGQTPLIKSRYLEYINNEEQPYGINAIVAIACYSGYNVEDAILINEGSLKRGMFRTTYYSMYEAHEESSNVTGMTSSKFANIQKNTVTGLKPGYDYSLLDDYGMIRENTPLHDKIVLIGKIINNPEKKDVWIDDSVTPKKGQLGFVDKVFMTEGEEGYNIAKVRVREERIPSIGDKMASRAGQKGTIGLIIPEQDMPFTADGIRPDLIINPHAIPSRMTIGQIIECLFGKMCVNYGGFGDCTAFQVKGDHSQMYGKMLSKAGFHSSGNQILYNGMTGQQLQSDIFIGPTYYMRLKHMVKDKINYRARGPNTMLTRQPVQGRANDGGLRIGEMERDGVMAHGMSYFLNESFLVRSDEYYIAVCNKTGSIAIYNEAKNLFLSPFADGPIDFHVNPDKTLNIKNISRFGRSFSILRVPYSFKLLMQELQTMNVQMRIITDENVDQMMNLAYSNNMNKLLKVDEKETLDNVIQNYRMKMNEIQKEETEKTYKKGFEIPVEEPILPDVAVEMEKKKQEEGAAVTQVEVVNEPKRPEMAPQEGMVQEQGQGQEVSLEKPESIQLQMSEIQTPESVEYAPIVFEKEKSTQSGGGTILDIEEIIELDNKNANEENTGQQNENENTSSSNGGEKKIIINTEMSNSDSNSDTSGTKKIII